MKPIIGVCPMYEEVSQKVYLNYGYNEAIIKCGGIPIVIPLINQKNILKEVFNYVDAIVLPGGSDVDPLLFGQEAIVENGEISPKRDFEELYLAQLAIKNNKPILGICRGCQVLNIAAGGDIYQDIYIETKTKLKHIQKAPKYYPTHFINILQNSIHKQIFKTTKIRVNSFHHQAVKDIGEGFIKVAESDDGIIEGIENINCDYCVGVQYHPELMWEKEKIFLELFKNLVHSCKNK